MLRIYNISRKPRGKCLKYVQIRIYHVVSVKLSYLSVSCNNALYDAIIYLRSRYLLLFSETKVHASRVWSPNQVSRAGTNNYIPQGAYYLFLTYIVDNYLCAQFMTVCRIWFSWCVCLQKKISLMPSIDGACRKAAFNGDVIVEPSHPCQLHF